VEAVIAATPARSPIRRVARRPLRESRASAFRLLRSQLPRSVIHNDANDHNLLVGPPTAAPEERAVTGLLDFGDMVETWTVCELSVAVAYAVFGQADPL
jgi:Ser/Thr protein kinase RdoA (MazF antagonist)